MGDSADHVAIVERLEGDTWRLVRMEELRIGDQFRMEPYPETWTAQTLPWQDASGTWNIEAVAEVQSRFPRPFTRRLDNRNQQPAQWPGF